MKPGVLLVLTSVLSSVLISIHLAEDIVLGYSGGGLANLFAIAVLAIYLSAALLWSDRRWGLAILLVGSLLALLMPVLHMAGAGVGVKRSEGAYFFVWTLYALGITGTVGMFLAAQALWGKQAPAA